MARRKFSDIDPTKTPSKPVKLVKKQASSPLKKANNARTKNRRAHKSNNDSHAPQHDKPVQKQHKLSDHFSRKDFHCKSGLAGNHFKISAGLVGALECLKYNADRRINIIKGYECNESAEKSGKLKRNYHVQGLAANISIEDMSLEDAYLLAEQLPEVTVLGINYDENYLHIVVKKEKERECWIERNKKRTLITDDNKQTLILDNRKVDQESEPA
jgi:uncharacterized protein YcbK (DUF882 family)